MTKPLLEDSNSGSTSLPVQKILVAEPIYSAMRPEVYANRLEFWAYMSKHSGARLISLILGPRRSIRSARQIAVQMAMEKAASHLFFMDDDILVQPDILQQLLRVDKPIVGGLMHRDDGDPIVFQEASIGEVAWRDHPKSGAFECLAVGAGCMLIRREVLETLSPRRRFLFNYDESERSMDVLFCRMARDAGFSVWCWPDDPCTQVRHY